MATIGSAKATLVNKIDSLTSSATAKDTIFLAKALKENTTHHSFTFLGAWAASTAYALDDVVTTSGNTYICILGYTSGSSFAVGSNWSIMAEKGTTVGTGTAGQVLKTNSAGTGTEWGEDVGGKLLNTVSGTNTGIFTVSGLTWTNIPNLSITITPDSASSRFVISWNGALGNRTSTANTHIRLTRNGTVINVGSGTNPASTGASPQSHWYISASFNYLDSPSTASAVTYTVQMRSQSGYVAVLGESGEGQGGASTDSRTGSPSNFVIMEVGA